MFWSRRARTWRTRSARSGSYNNGGPLDFGFLYSGGTYTPLSVGGNFTHANNINDAGQVVGFYEIPTTGVPGPIVGAGLPGLILASGGLLASKLPSV